MCARLHWAIAPRPLHRVLLLAHSSLLLRLASPALRSLRSIHHAIISHCILASRHGRRVSPTRMWGHRATRVSRATHNHAKPMSAFQPCNTQRAPSAEQSSAQSITPKQETELCAIMQVTICAIMQVAIHKAPLPAGHGLMCLISILIAIWHFHLHKLARMRRRIPAVAMAARRSHCHYRIR